MGVVVLQKPYLVLAEDEGAKDPDEADDQEDVRQGFF
jgi:hypothetical protein